MVFTQDSDEIKKFTLNTPPQYLQVEYRGPHTLGVVSISNGHETMEGEVQGNQVVILL